MSNRLQGRPVPPVVLSTADGARYDIADHQGRWRLLVFHRHLG
jgi:hypothetical protein